MKVKLVSDLLFYMWTTRYVRSLASMWVVR